MRARQRRSAGSRGARTTRRDHGERTGFPSSRQASSLGVAAVSRRAAHPVGVDAHAWAQTGDLLYRIGPDPERPQIEIAGRACRAPARIFAFGGDHPDLDDDPPIAQRWNAHRKTVADLETGDEVFA